MDTQAKERKPLEIRTGNKGPRFVRVYLSVMDSKEYNDLSDGAKAFWLWLLRKCQKPRGGDYDNGREYDWYTDELAEVAGISARSLQRYKGALINAGLLQTEKNHNPASGGRWRDTYIVHEIPLPAKERQTRKEEKAAPKMAKSEIDQTAKSGSLGGDKIGTLTIDKSLTNNYPKTPKSPLDKGDFDPEVFRHEFRSKARAVVSLKIVLAIKRHEQREFEDDTSNLDSCLEWLKEEAQADGVSGVWNQYRRKIGAGLTTNQKKRLIHEVVTQEVQELTSFFSAWKSCAYPEDVYAGRRGEICLHIPRVMWEESRLEVLALMEQDEVNGRG